MARFKIVHNGQTLYLANAKSSDTYKGIAFLNPGQKTWTIERGINTSLARTGAELQVLEWVDSLSKKGDLPDNALGLYLAARKLYSNQLVLVEWSETDKTVNPNKDITYDEIETATFMLSQYSSQIINSFQMAIDNMIAGKSADQSDETSVQPEEVVEIIEPQNQNEVLTKVVNAIKESHSSTLEQFINEVTSITTSFNNSRLTWKPSSRLISTLLKLNEAEEIQPGINQPSMVEYLACEYHLRADGDETPIRDLIQMYQASPEYKNCEMLKSKILAIQDDASQIGLHLNITRINKRLAIYVGEPGAGKSWAASHLVTATMGLSADMNASDIMKSFDFNDTNGFAKFKHSPLTEAIVNGTTVALEEFQKLHSSVQGALQSIFDNTEDIEVEGIKLKIHPNFKCIVTMNDTDMGMKQSLPEALLDRAYIIKFFENDTSKIKDWITEVDESNLLTDIDTALLSELSNRYLKEE